MITVDADFNIEKSKDEYDVIKVKINNKNIYIGSKYNMNDEINKFINRVENEIEEEEKRNQIIFIIYGIGNGEHIRRLRDKFKNNIIIVFEPNINLYNYIIQNKNFNNIDIVCGEKEELENIINKYLNNTNVSFVKNYVFSNYDKIYGKECIQFFNELKVIIANNVLIRNSFLINANEWFEMTIKNLPYFTRGLPVDKFKDLYKDSPAIIVSAGPSLKKNIKKLKEVSNNLVIISGPRTLKPLMINGIKPNFLCAIDSKEEQYNLCKDYIEEYNNPLLFYEHTNEKLLQKHMGQKVFFTISNFIEKVTGLRKAYIKQGTSVAHIMTTFAVELGCNPIIFIGQDLAYTNDKNHALIAESENEVYTFENMKRDDDLFVEGIDGKPIRTSLMLNSFRLFLEDIIKINPDIKFINATEGGSRIKGTIEMTLDDAINKYKANIIYKFPNIKNEVDVEKNIIEFLNNYKLISDMISKKCNQALKLLKKLENAYKVNNVNSINKILKELDEIDELIINSQQKMSIIENLLYYVDFEALQSEIIISDNPNLNEAKIIINQSEKYYKGVKEVIDNSKEYIDEALKNLITSSEKVEE